jgi:DNA-binding FrmR family transcriptional regulator
MNGSRAIRNRLRRIEGQVRGRQRLVEEDAPCIDIVTQVAAVQTALKQVAVEVLDAHVRGSVAQAISDGADADADETIDELLAALRRFSKRR